MLVSFLGQANAEDWLIKNKGPNCLWACAESIGRAKGISSLDGLLDKKYADYYYKRSYRATYEEIEKEFARLKVKQKHISVKIEEIPRYSIVNLKYNWKWGGIRYAAHAVIFDEYKDDTVSYWGPNYGKRFTVTKTWFRNNWSGECLIIGED